MQCFLSVAKNVFRGWVQSCSEARPTARGKRGTVKLDGRRGTCDVAHNNPFITNSVRQAWRQALAPVAYIRKRGEGISIEQGCEITSSAAAFISLI